MNKIFTRILTLVIFIVLIYSINVTAESEFSPQLQVKLNSAVLLHINQSKSYVKLNQIDIDSTNPEVYPLIKDGRTLVPVRFISESLGANVSWNNLLKEVTVKYNNNTVRLIIGSNKIYVNNTVKEIDVPAQIVNERTFIPLRALVEALGKKVFWDDRGIIVISDSENLFDAAKDQELINEIERVFSNIELEKAFLLMGNESIGFLYYGISESDVIKNLGQPDEKSEAIILGYDGREHQTWIYTKKGVQLDFVKSEEHDNKTVDMITITSPCNYKTKRNIEVGSTKTEVINAYKNFIDKDFSDEEQIVLGSIYGGIILKFENDRVSSIFVGAGAE